MNCSKCNQPMREYLGLTEKGWDCVNDNCKLEDTVKIVLPEWPVHEFASPVPGVSSYYQDTDMDDLVDALIHTLDKDTLKLFSGDNGQAILRGWALAQVEQQQALHQLFDQLCLDPHPYPRYIDESDDDYQFRLKALLDS